MATKGRGKSRPSSVRRPPGAPRVVSRPKPHVPWHRTRRGRTILAVGGLAVLILIAVIVIAITGGDENGAEELQTHTRELDAVVVGSLQEPATTLTQLVAGNDTPDDLGEQATALQEDLTAAQSELSGIAPPAGGATAQQILSEAVTLYADAAATLAEVADGSDAEIEVARSAAARMAGRASSLWFAGVAALDQARGEAGLSASALPAPVDPSAILPEVETDTGGGGTGGNAGEGGSDRDRDGGRRNDRSEDGDG